MVSAGSNASNREEEGWYVECDASHPAAVASWRIEPRYAPDWVYRARLAIRRLIPRPRPVLWGGRIERRANALDRLLQGRAVVIRLGDWPAIRLDQPERTPLRN
jgi:hypothetical protein